MLIAIIEICLENHTEAEKYLKILAESSSELFTNFMSSEKIELEFLSETKKCFKNLKTISFPDYPNIQLKPCLKLPQVFPPLDESDNFDLIFHMLANYDIQIRPEVPWMKKVKNVYKFTENNMEETFYCEKDENVKENVYRKNKSVGCFRVVKGERDDFKRSKSVINIE